MPQSAADFLLKGTSATDYLQGQTPAQQQPNDPNAHQDTGDVFARNSQYAKPSPGGGYITHLSAQEEGQFQAWVKSTRAPFDPSATADYDMRGFWKALQAGDPKAATAVNRNDGQMHFPDYWKTPYHRSFSVESQWATPAAPRWNEQDQLVLPDGRVVFDERAAQSRPTSAAAFLRGSQQPAKTGFWSDFGEGTGGFTGIGAAPFTESIPAEALKWGAHNAEEIGGNTLETMNPITGVVRTVLDHMGAFMAQPAEKPLAERVQDSFRTLVQTAKDRPGLVAGSFVKGMAADPELFFLPQLGGARAGAAATEAAEAAGAGARTAKVAGKVAGATAQAGGGAALGGGTELLREAGEGEPIELGQIGSSAAIGALASGLQIPIGKRTKMTPDEVTAVLATQPDPRATPITTIVPTHDGFAVQTGGRQVASFPTKEAAEAHATEIRNMGSAYSSLNVAPPGSAQAERTRFLHENPFTPDKMAKMIRRPSGDASMTGTQLAKFWGQAAGAAALGASVGALLDDEEPEVGATFGAAITLLPRALPKDRRISIEDAINERNGLLSQMARRTFMFKSAIDTAVPEELRRNAISLAMEGNAGVQLNEAEQRVATSARAFFDSMGNTAVDAGVLREMLTNYVTHIVEEDPRSSPSLVGGIVDAVMKRTNAAPPKSGRMFAQERKYATFGELQDALRGSGLKIKTGDIGEIVSIYSNAMFRTITDKRLLDALKASPVAAMEPQVLPPEAVRGPPPSNAPQLERQTFEGEATPAPDKLAAPQQGGLPAPTGQAVTPAAGSPGAGTADRSLPANPEGFQLPNPPPDPVHGDRRGPRNLVQPTAHMDSNYVVMPNRQLAGFAVHKDIAPQLNFVFSAKDPNDITLAMMALSQASKRAVISFSAFHAKSLADAFVGAMGTKGLTRGPGLVKAALDMYRKGGANDDIDVLLKHGLQVQVPEDVKTDEFNTALSRVASVVDRVLPVDAVGRGVHALAWANEKLDHFTFATLQTGFKLVTSLDALERLTVKGVPRPMAARMAASYANDIYGGLDWFRVANDVTSKIGRDAAYGFFSPTGRRWMQLAMFAPDWTFSTFRAAYKALPGAVDDPALAALHRRYLAKSAIYYLTVANAINFVTAGHSIFSNVNPTRVQLEDGRSMQFSKHFMEPFEWLRDPIQTADNKLAFLPRALVEIGTGKQYISAHDTAPDIESRAKTIAEMFLPINAQQGLAGGGAQSLLGLVGMPIYGKTPEQKAEARKEKKLHEREKKKKTAEYLQKLHR